MSKLPDIPKGHQYLYLVPLGETVELIDGRMVKVESRDGLSVHCRDTDNKQTRRYVFEVVKMSPIKKNNKEKNKNGTLPKLQRNSKRSGR